MAAYNSSHTLLSHFATHAQNSYIVFFKNIRLGYESMSKWEVDIYRYSDTSRMSGDTFWISEKYDNHDQLYFYIDSDCFEMITPDDQNKAQSIIYGLVTIANGAFVLATRDVKKHINVNTSLIFYDEKRVSFFRNDFIPSMNPFEGLKTIKINFSVLNIENRSHLISLAHAYQPIREILFQVGCFIDDQNLQKNISTWTILYAIKDTVFYYTENFCPECLENKKNMEDKIVRFLDIDKTELKRFTQTANNFDYLGMFARHGKQSWEQPKAPMNVNEAFSFVFNVAMSFIAKYINNQLSNE